MHESNEHEVHHGARAGSHAAALLSGLSATAFSFWVSALLLSRTAPRFDNLLRGQQEQSLTVQVAALLGVLFAFATPSVIGGYVAGRVRRVPDALIYVVVGIVYAVFLSPTFSQTGDGSKLVVAAVWTVSIAGAVGGGFLGRRHAA